MAKKNSAITSLILFFTVLIAGVFALINLRFTENLNSAFPNVEQYEFLSRFIEEGKRSFVFSIALPENSSNEETQIIADRFIEHLQPLDKFVGEFQYKTSVDPDEFYDQIVQYSYLFYGEEDYRKLAHSLSTQEINNTLKTNKEKLISTEGIGLKRYIVSDPLHFSKYAFQHIQAVFSSEDMIDNEGLYYSKDKDKLFVLSKVQYDPNNVGLNKEYDELLNQTIESWSVSEPNIKIDYFGTCLIAVANANQIKQDIIITINIALVFVILLLLYYYKRVSVLLLFLIPGVFGLFFSFFMIYLFQGEISGLALSASAVIFGIVVDYSFHFFSHYKECGDADETRKQVWFPMLISGFTTVLAFSSLILANSKTLHDFGLFTSLSLAGALFFVLVLLPSVLKLFGQKVSFNSYNKLDALFSKITVDGKKVNKPILLSTLVVTFVLLYFSYDIQFENDLNAINYYPEALKERERVHQNINPDTEKRLNFILNSDSKEEALQHNELLLDQLTTLQKEGKVKSISSINSFISPQTTWKKQQERWNEFWKTNRDSVYQRLLTEGKSVGFKAKAFKSANNLMQEAPDPAPFFDFINNQPSFKHLILSSENNHGYLTSIIVNKADIEQTKTTIKALPFVQVVDGSSIMSSLIDTVKQDFNFLLLFAGISVFIAMILIYGRIELTLISFLPMALSWIWILGLASLFGIKFNFVNVILATFIFGLGDDFAIFITDGLQSKYKEGKSVIDTYKSGIVLSSITTILGTGVLIFAVHPAIKSIAAISVLGILSIVIISFAIQPLLFRFFITQRIEKGLPPMTIRGILLSVFAFSYFLLGSILIKMITGVLIITPLFKKKQKQLFVHKLIQICTKSLIYIMANVPKNVDTKNLDLSKPSIIIANHSSFLDLLITLMLHPKIVIMVNSWVYHSPVFGWFIRYTDFLPAFVPIDQNIDKAKELINDGYSILVFPEGKRSVDGKIGRFHKGAFFLSKELKLDIIPIVLHGLHYTLPKTDYYLKSAQISLRVLPRIQHDDPRFGTTYKEQTKAISRFFKAEHEKFTQEIQTSRYFFNHLLFSYFYKGPIVEWYFRIKYKIEAKHYEDYHRLIGFGKKKIYDLGCGYGYLPHFLKLAENKREIIGIDYDAEKVALAQNSYLMSEGISFKAQDINSVEIENADVIFINDVLHYLQADQQLKVLENCVNNLSPNGMLFIRDGITDLGEKHNWTKKSEKWSTRLVKFNKTSGDLHFFSKQFIIDFAEKHQLSVEIKSHSEKSSNVLFILRKEA